MTDSLFDQLDRRLAEAGVAGMLAALAEELDRRGQPHELFDVRLMQARHKLGLPAVSSATLDEIAEPQRGQLEAAYLAACREVGGKLLDAGKLREAWLYLRPAGERARLAEALVRTAPTDENVQELVELALHEAVAPEWGFGLVLEHFGTCNAITTFEGLVAGRGKAEQQAAAGLLLRRLHRDLVANLRADIARREGREPPEETLAELVRDRGDLFGEYTYHIDTTHLASVVRLARIVEEPELLRLALDLTEYGRRLSQPFQFSGEEPFVEIYPTHGLWFAAQLGQQVEEALAHFRGRAAAVDPAEHGPAAVEAHAVLLARLGRVRDAIDAVASIPAGVRPLGWAPSLLELSRRAGDYSRLMSLARGRRDVLNYAAALIGRADS